MREQLLDVLERLVRVRSALGEAAFERACMQARIAIGRSVLAEATASVKRVRSFQTKRDRDQNLSLTTNRQEDTI